jgi:hypothetical protein
LRITFSEIATDIEVWEFAEVDVKINGERFENPFTELSVRGTLFCNGSQVAVNGFCDSADGSCYKVRFLAVGPGLHTYTIEVTSPTGSAKVLGSFNAVASKREGLLRVDGQHPFHFKRAGSKSNFFWNGTTAYFLFGWDMDGALQVLDRLHQKGINHVRAALNARTYGGSNWSEDSVVETDRFTFRICPWEAQYPESVETPKVDAERYNVEYWRHVESILAYAGKLGITVSVIFYVDGQHARVDPFGKEGMGSPQERNYYKYAAARLSAFENVIWCVTNEYHLFRDDAWVESTGAWLMGNDPYGRVCTVHGYGEFHFMASAWPGYASYQVWDEPGGNGFMLQQRALQEASGKIIPQVNEEYGYEDTYPQWGFAYVRPMRSADTRRRIAWSISMAGCYQTTGERADTGTGAGQDTGGGWINGRGDDSMVMLDGYKIMVDFFKSIPWYALEPSNDLVTGGALCLSNREDLFVVYLPEGKGAELSVPPGNYEVELFDPKTGVKSSVPFELRSGNLQLSGAEPTDCAYLVWRAV